jgi:catechol 2,3-dioxygenase-like lactoylglutathione lyase family enzyme
MKDVISKLLKSYDDRKLSRRELAQGLAVLAAGAGTASAAGFQGNTINHISLQVSDLNKSSDFYRKVLGVTVNVRDGSNQAMFGRDFLVLRKGSPAGKIDHIAIGINNFNKDSVTADLKSRGVTPKEDTGGSGVGFHILDPDGFPLQLVTSANTGQGKKKD